MTARAPEPLEAALIALLGDGRAYTPAELARASKTPTAGVREQLRRLESGGTVVTRRQGPHRYFHLAPGTRPAQVSGQHNIRTGPGEPAMRAARVCYGHLAGPRGVRLFDAFADRGLIVQDGDSVRVTPRGWSSLTAFGIDRANVEDGARPLCKLCLDWSERRSHLGGPLATAILDRIVALGWASRDTSSRLLTFSAAGAAAFDAQFAE